MTLEKENDSVFSSIDYHQLNELQRFQHSFCGYQESGFREKLPFLYKKT